MENIIFKNRIEVKILIILYSIIFIPASILLAILVINTKDYPLLFLYVFIVLFIGILLIVNHFKIVFDFENKIIKYTGYFKKEKVYSFNDINVSIVKNKDSFNDNFDYIFSFNESRLFKINNLNFFGETKRSIDLLDLLLNNIERSICSLKRLNIKDGYIGFYSYELAERIATIYLENNYSINVGYANNFRLEVLNSENKIIDEVISTSDELFNKAQELIQKYQ